MHIIIDGYNLIRQSDCLRRHEKQSLEAGRRALILRLAEYKRKKGHQITVVFDGWEKGSAMEERDRQENIGIIYSRRGEKADDVIKRLADNSSEETVIISSDREIASYVTRHGKTALSSTEFEMLMLKAITESAARNFAAGKEADDEIDRHSSKKGPAKRLPRTRRHAQTKIKKL
ncbi:MAG: NYN domain-containing protein [Smithellaceae bacterium]